MKNIGLHEIRREFLEFFKEKEHLVAPSYSLIPKNDKSLLLIGAGMAPLKKYFTGEAVPPKSKMATCQKCIRTGDIENVGKTDRHATFFEMLGNFSFGDYFKTEAIHWAWEFLTERMEIDEEDLWVSIYEEDIEAFEIWNKQIHVPKERIVPLGKADNFWELEVGPSGPCSEIYIDRGEKYGCGDKDCKPGCECDRFIEVWNLVFTQFDKDQNGVYNPLAHPNIDTGMGLERIAAVIEKADNIFEVKAIQEILHTVEKISGIKYNTNKDNDMSIRVITDHVRAMTFMVSDGILPSNEGRGYVLRRLIRRASRHGKLLGIDREFLNEIVDVVIDSWKVEYKEIETRRVQIKKIIKAEEDKFQETIDQGIYILEEYIENMNRSGEKTLNGEDAFKLYDTFGFPLDLTREILEEKDLDVDEKGFNEHMKAQRDRARSARESDKGGWKSRDEDLFKGFKSSFRGYDTLSTKSSIIGIFKNNKNVSYLETGDEGIIVLDETPFYGESGGQVGDKGIIGNETFSAIVNDTKIGPEKTVLHMVNIVGGRVKQGEKVISTVDEEDRLALMRNHSATHLLHQALKDTLGEHVNQAGSIVLSNRLRFDFTHFEALTTEQLKEIELKVNMKVLEALDVKTIKSSLEDAKETGAIGLFEAKYGEEVRIIKMGDYSQELCGGTHVKNTGSIGLFKIISESGIASGVRRIEAITGLESYKYLNNLEIELDDLSSLFKTNRENLLSKSHSIIDELKQKDNEIEKLKKEKSKDISKKIINSKIEIDGVNLITYRLEDMDMDSLRNLGDELKNKIQSGVIVLASVVDEKILFLTMVTKDLNKRKISAGNIIREVAKATGGNGGGRPDMAQAGGKDINKLDNALEIVVDLIKDSIKA